MTPLDRLLRKIVVLGMALSLFCIVLTLVIYRWFFPYIWEMVAGTSVTAVVLHIFFISLPEKIRRVHCGECGWKYTSENLHWEEQKRTFSRSGKKVIATLEVECRCSYCDAVRRFSKSVSVAALSHDGKETSLNLQPVMQKFFK